MNSPSPDQTSCMWSQDDEDGFWETECGQAFQFEADGPTENGFSFCPWCGKHLDPSPADS